MSKFQPFFSLKHPKVRPFLEYLSQAVPKVPEIKFTRLTWIFQKSSQLPCLLMSLWDLKNASLCTVKMKGEIVFFLRCTRLPRLPSFTLLYYSKAVLQEHGSVCVFFPLLAICRCAKVFLEAKWAEKNNEKAFSFRFLCFTIMGS